MLPCSQPQAPRAVLHREAVSKTPARRGRPNGPAAGGSDREALLAMVQAEFGGPPIFGDERLSHEGDGRTSIGSGHRRRPEFVPPPRVGQFTSRCQAGREPGRRQLQPQDAAVLIGRITRQRCPPSARLGRPPAAVRSASFHGEPTSSAVPGQTRALFLAAAVRNWAPPWDSRA